jgi:hypothetical protein
MSTLAWCSATMTDRVALWGFRCGAGLWTGGDVESDTGRAVTVGSMHRVCETRPGAVDCGRSSVFLPVYAREDCHETGKKHIAACAVRRRVPVRAVRQFRAEVRHWKIRAELLDEPRESVSAASVAT